MESLANTERSSVRALIVSVGGAPAPVIVTLNRHKPKIVWFFASQETRELIPRDILPNLEFSPDFSELIVTPNAEELVVCFETLRKELPGKLEFHHLSWNDLQGDYTGGTKTMSAALVLALVEHGCRFSYVGGSERSKGGVGVVVDGSERMLFVANPWEVLGVDVRQRVGTAFRHGRFFLCKELLGEAIPKASSKDRPIFGALKEAIEILYLWDELQYKDAASQLDRCMGKLCNTVPLIEDPVLTRFLDQMEKAAVKLKEVATEFNFFVSSQKGTLSGDGLAVPRDLVANAIRRATFEERYGDAISRLYAAVEKMAKGKLIAKYGIDNSNADPSKLGSLRAENETPHRHGDGRKIQFGSEASFRLLAELGDELGKRYETEKAEFDKVLSIRNNSVFVHGYDIVRKDVYERMLSIVLSLLEIDSSMLPVFPELGW